MERRTSLLQKKIDDVRLSLKETHAARPTERIGIILIVISDLFGGLLVGCALAYLVCHLLEAHLIFGAILILLGGIAGFLNIYKSMKKLEARRGEKKNENA